MNYRHKTKRWNTVLRLAFGSLLGIILVIYPACSRQPERSPWLYQEFIRAVEQDQVESVILNADQSQALVETHANEHFLVNLPTDPTLLETLNRHGVEVSVSPQLHQTNPSDILPFLLLQGFIPLVIPGLLVVLGFAFWVWVLIDCATKEATEGNTKLAWILIIVLTQWIGALLYFLIRRPERRRELGQ